MFPRLWLVLNVFFYWKAEAVNNAGCDLSKISTTYLYVCPIRLKQKIEIYVDPSRIIEITCYDIISMNQSVLPEIDHGKELAELRVKHCPIIMHNGFQEIMKKFHIEKLFLVGYYGKTSNDFFQLEHFVGLKSVQKLVFVKNNITLFDGNIFKLIPRLSHLDLHENNLLLYNGLFKYAPKLIELNLSYNSIKVLPRDIFEGLFNLTFLRLLYNKIETIDNYVFRDLMNLEVLQISDNFIHQLNENAFEYQHKLRNIDMNSNKLEYISKKLFHNCTNLEKIFIKRNNVSMLENLAISEFVYLNLITLRNNGIVEIPEDIFLGSLNLYEINIQRNKLKSLPRNIFKNLKLLEKLYLDDNQLRTLHADTFSSLNNLRLLNLRKNLLVTVNEGLLKDLENLEYLDLSFNNIYTIDSDMFEKKYNLVNVWINNNHLDFTGFSPKNMHDCGKLEVLNFANNSISQFPYRMVETLMMQHTKHISDVASQNQTKGFKEIMVYLQHNNISEIRFDRFYFEKSPSFFIVSVQVDLSENPINCDCKSLDLISKNKTKKYATIYLRNHITLNYDDLYCADPPHLVNTALREIDTNELTCSLENKCPLKNECDCSYKSATGTIKIDCSKRNLSDIPRLELDKLTEYFDFVKINRVEVHLEDNSLTIGPSEHDGYHNVRELYLQRNKIKLITWIPPYVEILNLENNHLEFLDFNILNSLNASLIKGIRLSNNPWRCDCETKYFINHLWTHISKISNASHIRCQAVGKPLFFLDVEEFCSVRLVLASVLSSAILICFIILSALILVYYVYHEEILIWLYAKDTCLWLVKEERLDKNRKYDAFVSFSHQDEEFVVDQLIPMLELGNPQYKLCIHIRDWIPGEYIATQIANSVRDSRRTLIILSSDFITSIWGRIEFKTAHISAMREGRVRIILVIYGEVKMDELDDELKAYIRTNTYIKWGDPWFWEKLRYALPRTRYRTEERKEP